jgi:hypothetical protein
MTKIEYLRRLRLRIYAAHKALKEAEDGTMQVDVSFIDARSNIDIANRMMDAMSKGEITFSAEVPPTPEVPPVPGTQPDKLRPHTDNTSPRKAEVKAK